MAARHTFELYPGPDLADFLWHDTNGAWANQTGHAIYLKELRWWMGADRGLIADCLGALYLSHSDTATDLLWSCGWDRYHPDDCHFDAVPLVYAPDYVLMQPGEWLTLKRRASPQAAMPGDLSYPQPLNPRVLQVIRGWYTDTP